MRIYCLSSIEKITPNPIITKPYDENAAENLFTGPDEFHTKLNITRSKTLKYYQLTEICIGYKYIQRNNQHYKVFIMNIYRNDTHLLTFKMIRGAVSLSKVNNNATDLTINFLENDFLHGLKIRIRCIKNTHELKYLTKAEEEFYEAYAKRLLDYSGNNKELRESAFEQKEFSFDIPNQSAPKKISDKINELQQLITLLCHPKTGSYNNVPIGAHYCQEADCLLQEKNFLSAETTRSLDAKIKNFHGYRSIVLHNLNLNKCKIENVDYEKIDTIRFHHVTIYNETLLHPIFDNLNVSNLTKLHLKSCNIKELSETFINMLPRTLQILDLENNNIATISNALFQLENLDKLLLNDNKNLSNDGFSFKYFPKRVTVLEMMNTNISEISEDISNLSSLLTLRIGSKKLKFVSWDAISPSIQYIKIEAGGKLNGLNLKNKDYLIDLNVSYAGIEEIDCAKLPINLKHLSLHQNLITHFNSKKALPMLSSLNLSSNKLKSLCFENLSHILLDLCICSNHLKRIENISHLKNLTKFDATHNVIESIDESIGSMKNLSTFKLYSNKISALPNGFENLRKLEHLDLEENNFNFQITNLEEVLWKRLPKSLKTLNLDKNNLYELPCHLGNFYIRDLNVRGCNLQHICPYIYTQWRRQAVRKDINISNNPKLTHIPFIPIEIYQPPAYNEQQEKEKLEHTTLELTTDVMKENDKKRFKFKTTEKFPTNDKRKPLYDFKPLSNPSVNCKCCGICGESTEAAIKQFMVMDFVIHFYDDDKYLEISKFYDWTERMFDNNYGEESNVYGPGKWKTEIRTRLCLKCQRIFKKKTDEAFEEFKKSQEQNGLDIKRCKETVAQRDEATIETQIVHRPLTPVQNSFYIQNKHGNTINPNFIHPPIETIYRQPWNDVNGNLGPSYQVQMLFDNAETTYNLSLERNSTQTILCNNSQSQQNCLYTYNSDMNAIQNEANLSYEMSYNIGYPQPYYHQPRFLTNDVPIDTEIRIEEITPVNNYGRNAFYDQHLQPTNTENMEDNMQPEVQQIQINRLNPLQLFELNQQNDNREYQQHVIHHDINEDQFSPSMLNTGTTGISYSAHFIDSNECTNSYTSDETFLADQTHHPELQKVSYQQIENDALFMPTNPNELCYPNNSTLLDAHASDSTYEVSRLHNPFEIFHLQEQQEYHITDESQQQQLNPTLASNVTEIVHLVVEQQDGSHRLTYL